MARLAGIEMNDKDRVAYALTRINGIGWSSAIEIMNLIKMDQAKRMSELTTEELALLAAKLDEYTTEGDLVRKIRSDIQRLREIGAYRGIRHARGLPVRGQRTKTNARTKRGKRKTVGAFKKEALTKMTTNVKEEPNAKK
jgi:small subunit ribosomal protein S13